jgi:pimeloyl-ACP methyl ester carboxylesterase
MRHLTVLALSMLIAAASSAALPAASTDDLALPKDLSQEYLLDRYATPTSNFAYLNRTMVHYRDEGRGPAVLLIHGSLQDLYDWDGWTASLSPNYRVVRLDLPGAGLTGRVGSDDYSIDNTMRTIDALMDRLGESHFAVVGTSLGGVVAFRYAATRPERVAALVLMNSAGVEWGNEKIIPPTPRRYNESLSDTLSRRQVATILNAVVADPAKVPEKRIDRTLDYQRRLGRDAEAAAVVAAYQRGKPEEVLARIRAPVLLLWGSANRALEPGVADRFAALLTGAPVVEKTLVAAGHWPHVEAPVESVGLVEAFFARHYTRSPVAPGVTKGVAQSAGEAASR